MVGEIRAQGSDDGGDKGLGLWALKWGSNKLDNFVVLGKERKRMKRLFTAVGTD